MSRKPVSADTQTVVLVRSRRRCCICYGLNRDVALKVGQIAHLDRNNANAAEDNLSFLCFEHHDEYDARTSQRKGLTLGEVKAFRKELYEAIGKAFSISVHFGVVTLPECDPVAGQYIRTGGINQSAELTITPLDDGAEGRPRYAVTGYALWGTDNKHGPNIGDLAFIGTLENGVIEYTDDWPRNDKPHVVHMTFLDGKLAVEESNWDGLYGMNVTFVGEYQRA